MPNITDILIVNSHTIQLNQDAKKGDVIDLNAIEHIDSSILTKKINEAMNTQFQHMLDEEKKKWETANKIQLQRVLKEKDKTIIQLNEQLKLKENQAKQEVESTYRLELETLRHQIETLKSEKQNLRTKFEQSTQLSKLEVQSEFQEKVQKYQREIDALKQEKKYIEEKAKLTLENAVNDKERKLNAKIIQLEQEMARLKLEKSSLNIKLMGEQLESWVDQEFQNHALNGFETCTWEKDNLAVKAYNETKGTKADYLFKVYADTTHQEETLLTSVAIEIKSEDPRSTHRKKNADHYDKLDKDRKKKHCEYALLVSELEWETSNDAPIRKVQGYEKMYMVRPQYFMVFLNLVSAIALQYKENISQYHVDLAKFKDAKEIKDNFQSMKEDILLKSMKYISDRMAEIRKSAQTIQKESSNIIKAADIVMNRHLQAVINKIENFKIDQVVSEIERLNR